MNAELQLRIWQCLPKEAREEIKMIFNMPSKYGYPDSVRKLLIDIYGNNLTSDIEPSELLFVERKDVIEYFAEVNKTIETSTNRSVISQSLGKRTALKALFGDKCQPDKEPSVQVEPKFNIGDKVRKSTWDKDTTISMVEWHGTWETFVYHFKEQEYGFNCHKENDLTLVSKRAKDPIFSIGDKVQLQFDWCRLLKGTLLTIKGIPTIDRDNTFMYSFEETDEYIRETMLEPYTEPETKDNTQQNSWDDNFKRFNECCNKIRETLESLCNSFDKMKNCIDRL